MRDDDFRQGLVEMVVESVRVHMLSSQHVVILKELERDLRRKDKALAETTALLVLSKKFEAILQRDEEE